MPSPIKIDWTKVDQPELCLQRFPSRRSVVYGTKGIGTVLVISGRTHINGYRDSFFVPAFGNRGRSRNTEERWKCWYVITETSSLINLTLLTNK